MSVAERGNMGMGSTILNDRSQGQRIVSGCGKLMVALARWADTAPGDQSSMLKW